MLNDLSTGLFNFQSGGVPSCRQQFGISNLESENLRHEIPSFARRGCPIDLPAPEGKIKQLNV